MTNACVQHDHTQNKLKNESLTMHFQQYKGMSNEEARLQQSAVPTGSEKRYVPPESMRKVEEKIMREANEKVTRN